MPFESPEMSMIRSMIVESTRRSRQRDGAELHYDGFYVLTSRNLGRTWTVFDMSCTDERAVQAIAPGWSGLPKLPDQRGRLTQVESAVKSSAPGR